jgi:LuxR family transcriptional regulator, maltose regulon positive regulatory protein
VRARPALCVYAAWALLVNGRPMEAVEARLNSAGGGGSPLASLAAPLHAFIAIYRGQTALAAKLSLQALEQLPEREAFLRSLAALTLGAAYIANGQTAAAQPALDEAARLSHKTGNVMIAVTLLCYLAELGRREGQLHKTQALYLEALERATDEHGRRWPVAGRALLGLGEIEREWNDLESAAAHLAEGIELTLRGGQLGAIEGYLELARVRQAQGEIEDAFAAIQKARQLARQSELSNLNDIAIDLFQATLWILQGNLAEARQWAERRGLDKNVQPAEMDQSDDYVKYHFRKYEYVVAARLWIADGRAGEALALLDQAAPRVEKLNRPRLAIEMHLLRALAFQAQGQTEIALSALERALELAEPEGYVRLFVDEGEPLRLLILDCRFSIEKTHPDFKNYVEELLAAFAQADHSELGSSSQSKIQNLKSKIWFEPLSDRERDVLRLLATSLSAAEIADALSVAVSTVRSHTKNIYSKLGVNGRLAAVEQAKALGLL